MAKVSPEKDVKKKKIVKNKRYLCNFGCPKSSCRGKCTDSDGHSGGHICNTCGHAWC